VAWVLGSHWIDLTVTIQYSIRSEDAGFHGDRLRSLPDPVSVRNEIIPDPDSVPLSVLNHPIGSKHETDFSAYDCPSPTVPPAVDGPDAV